MVRPSKAPSTAQLVADRIAELEAVAPTPPPVVVEDAGSRLYQDRAGSARNTGLTEGSSNFATITAEARRAAGLPE